MNNTDNKLIFEAFTRREEDNESGVDFEAEAENFIDSLSDDQLEFLMNIGSHQFEDFMQMVKDEHGSRISTGRLFADDDNSQEEKWAEMDGE